MMTVRIRTMFFLLSLIALSGCTVINNACAREDKLKFDEPISNWLQIGCSDDGVEYLAANEGYQWLDQQGEVVKLFADIRQLPGQKTKGEYFESQHPKKLVTFAVDNFNKFLSENLQSEFNFNDIYKSRVFTKNKWMSYELNFYVEDDKDMPAYLTICIANCHEIDPISFTVVKKY